MSRPPVLAAGERPGQTLTATRGAMRVMAGLGFPPLPEVTLAHGRRADLVGVGRDGSILIVEVKSCEADYRADLKWPHYLPYADLFAFAVPPGFPLPLLSQPQALPERTGVIVADGFDGALVREPAAVKLPPARRKALTRSLARLGAQRLMGALTDV